MKLSPIGVRRLVLGLLGVVLIASMVYVVLRSGPLAPTRVTVVHAVEGRLTPALFGIGTVEARRSYLIGPTVAGRVRAVAVDVGDTVKAGQLLAEMDPVDLDERTAALDASVARAGSAMAAADAQRRDALARKELAAVNARRYVELGQQNFISAGAVEARLQEQASADAIVSAADANIRAATQDQQRLVAERAGLRQQRANVRLLAPADGVVTSRDAEPGSTVVAGQAVLRLIEPSSLWVKVRLDQARSAGLTAGLPAQVVLRSHPGRAFAGKVARVEAISDSVTEERVALVSFDQAPASLSVGELAEVTLSLPSTETTVLLPNAAIKRTQAQTGVWVIDAGALRFVPVRIGQSTLDGQVQVLDGLRPGTTVVVHSERDIGAHSRIKVVDALVGRTP
ncbi:MAG: efflux RND transporter periplasmic adaptor subunit [Rubrivivax sp.]|nr:efflux RND transporter periplasmic adaptor subunit [Rubrivivax sp.]MDP3613434.1 efflux RND transporter periplasmic adaptor subunit [Rubrivivax sp.]